MDHPQGVIFVLGMLRSGTTMIGQMLGTHPDVFVSGELSNLWSSYDNDASCQCGQLVAQCDFWASVGARVRSATGLAPSQIDRLRLSVARNRNFRAALGARHSLTAMQRDYVDVRRALHTAIRSESGRRVIVDTSKRAIEFFFVSQSDRASAVHMVRDPLEVARSEKDSVRFSHLAPGDRPPVRSPLMSAVVWRRLNGQAASIGRRHSEAHVRAYLEHVLADPGRVLDAVIATQGLQPFDWPARDGGFEFTSGHVVNGNPSRKNMGLVPLQRRNEELPPLSNLERRVVQIVSGRASRLNVPSAMPNFHPLPEFATAHGLPMG